MLDQLRLNHALVWFMVNLSILRFSREKYPVIHSDCKFIIDAFFLQSDEYSFDYDEAEGMVGYGEALHLTSTIFMNTGVFKC